MFEKGKEVVDEVCKQWQGTSSSKSVQGWLLSKLNALDGGPVEEKGIYATI